MAWAMARSLSEQRGCSEVLVPVAQCRLSHYRTAFSSCLLVPEIQRSQCFSYFDSRQAHVSVMRILLWVRLLSASISWNFGSWLARQQDQNSLGPDIHICKKPSTKPEICQLHCHCTCATEFWLLEVGLDWSWAYSKQDSFTPQCRYRLLGFCQSDFAADKCLSSPVNYSKYQMRLKRRPMEGTSTS
jgi:hypothetical protein